MSKFSIAAVASLAFLAVPALAASEEEKAPPTAETAAKPEPKICKKDRTTGSLARVTKVCLTKSEWRELNAKTRDNIDSYSRNVTRSNGGAGQAGGPS